ncbi:MAG: hypothetical protein OER86_07465 [Phycisphaerae bacterium]|nr:hypothetical protein [Phycisphaerae bacterium]
MKAPRHLAGILIGLGAAVSASPLLTAESQDLATLTTLIKPTAAESKWLSIPWETSLWRARERAAAEGKPILLWEMDGNPMGCT